MFRMCVQTDSSRSIIGPVPQRTKHHSNACMTCPPLDTISRTRVHPCPAIAGSGPPSTKSWLSPPCSPSYCTCQTMPFLSLPHARPAFLLVIRFPSFSKKDAVAGLVAGGKCELVAGNVPPSRASSPPPRRHRARVEHELSLLRNGIRSHGPRCL